MSVIPNLAGSPLNLIAIREEEKKILVELLKRIDGDKCLILNTQLSKPLMMVTEDASLLKNCGVKTFLTLDSPVQSVLERSVVFFVKPTCDDVKRVASIINDLDTKEFTVSYYMLFFPCITRITKEMMIQKNIVDRVTVMDTNMDIFPLDDDILSLEWNTSFSDLLLEHDYTSLQLMANAIMRMQSLYGVIPNVTAIGSNAMAVVDMLKQKRTENKEKESSLPPEIHHLIVIDRNADLVSPFVFPLTYEGLIDEVMDIDCGATALVEKEMDRTEGDQKVEKEVKTILRLNNTDGLFQELRDENIIKVIHHTQEAAKQLKEEQDSRPGDTSSINEFMEYSRKLPELVQRRKLLELHIRVLGMVTSVSNSEVFRKLWEMELRILDGEVNPQDIVDLADENVDFMSVMRLLILKCLVNNGLPPKSYDPLRRSLVQVYGFQIIPIFDRLQQLHILFAKETNGNFPTLRSRMRLMKDGMDGRDTSDMAYVTSGYAPLTGRLVQATLTQGGISPEIAKIMTVPVQEITQEISFIKQDMGMKKKVALVVFVGGCSFLEVAAIRQLKHLENFGYEIVMLVSNLTNGKKILNELDPKLPPIPLPPKQQ